MRTLLPPLLCPVAAGILPAVESGILPGGMTVLSYSRAGPGGRMPAATGWLCPDAPFAALPARPDGSGVAVTSQVDGFGVAWLILGELRAAPPTAAQRLKERRRVSVAIGLGLDEVQHGLLVCLFRG